MKVNQVLGGRYELREQLGSGGMAVVWRAHDEVLGRSVAIKVLAGAHVDDPSARQRIRDEARHAATLSHPNIAQVHDFGESPNDGVVTPYVVMELVGGQTLSEVMSAGQLPQRDALRICAEVAAAVAAAHADGLVHRDIKPANVMVTPAGVKVVDFGIAAAISSADGHPGPLGTELLGTPAYVAPERLTGTTVEPASDVYAIGVLLYRLLAGHPPWIAETATQMLSAHVYVEPAALPHIPGLPEYVAALCARCLDKDPTNRPTARDVAAVLARAASAAPAVAGFGVGPSVAAPGGSAAMRRRRLLVSAGAAAVAVTAGLIWIVAPRGQAGVSPAVGAARPSVLLATAAAPAASDDDDDDRTVSARPGSVPPTSAGVPKAALQPRIGTDRPVPRGEPTGAVTAPRPTPKPTPKPTKPAPEPGDEQTFTSVGGSVTARCPKRKRVELVAWQEKDPYTLVRVRPGPAKTAVAVFGTDTERVRMTVTCVGGIPESRTTVVEL